MDRSPLRGSRHPQVPFSHHRLVTKFHHKDRAELLQACADSQFSLDQFRAYIAEWQGKEPPVKVQTDSEAILSLCGTKEGKVWDREDTNAVRFWLGR